MGKVQKLESMEDGEESKSAIPLSSSDDEEANKDLSLAIVEKARKLESSRKRAGADDPIVIPSDSSDDVDLVMNSTEEVKEEKKRKKRKLREKKKSRSKKKDDGEEEEKQVTADAVLEEEPSGATDPVVAKVDGESDNVILRKLLRGPRYFDPGERNLEACFNCGEEGHRAVDCTEEKRQKPCFVCGMFGHNAKQCTQGQDCYICKRRGHIAKNCPDKHNRTSSDSVICLRCGDLGHDILSCNNDYSHEDLKGIQCYICKDYGHLCCMDVIVNSAIEVSCYNCAQSGHNGLGCNAKRGRTNELCYKCGEEGHFARGCTKYAKFDRWEDRSTPRRFANENYEGSQSVPIGFGRAHKKKSMHYDDRWNNSTGKSRIKGGWSTEDPGDLPRRKHKAKGWNSPSTPVRSKEVYSSASTENYSSSQSPFKKHKSVAGTPRSHHGYAASRFRKSHGYEDHRY
ncbi:protein AIR1 [Iris pallida]|uniref:Protein AIR1 n=2 Tax=Iris pallida TaxID=29817 RepID=A0AAX6I3N6_IRIPA|nr:protein AIR1 [Iris pallida]